MYLKYKKYNETLNMYFTYKNYNETVTKIEQVIENLNEYPEIIALIRLISETGIRFGEACDLSADEFIRGKYHSPKLGKSDMDLPAITEDTRKMILKLMDVNENTIFKKDKLYYRNHILRKADELGIKLRIVDIVKCGRYYEKTAGFWSKNVAAVNCKSKF